MRKSIMVLALIMISCMAFAEAEIVEYKGTKIKAFENKSLEYPGMEYMTYVFDEEIIPDYEQSMYLYHTDYEHFAMVFTFCGKNRIDMDGHVAMKIDGKLYTFDGEVERDYVDVLEMWFETVAVYTDEKFVKRIGNADEMLVQFCTNEPLAVTAEKMKDVSNFVEFINVGRFQ